MFALLLILFLLALWKQLCWRRDHPFMDYVAEYERQVQEDEARIVPGLGQGGAAAQLGTQSVEQKFAINVYLSERIAYNRTLKDYRNSACKSVVYDAELPSASVIIIFHNEPYSVVVRTVWSVVNSARRHRPWHRHATFSNIGTGRSMTFGYYGQDPNSPFVYLKEIILVDDNSTLPELKGKLSHYVRTRLPPDLIRILRLPDHFGLIRARLAGARYAAGDVLVFLDAHCEVQADWLRPLLQRIKEAPHAVVMPIIDEIDSKTLEYTIVKKDQVYGFLFTGFFISIKLSQREKKRRGSDIAPTWSPVMAGGLFAINRQYFWDLGAYDEQMAGWGGENLEMSFRVWQCGGTLEQLTCSRVGHLYRAFHPKSLPTQDETHGINTARMAEVWMDEYKELFYMYRSDLRMSPKIGDITHRHVLREKLQCKSFQWYLDHVYPDKFVPVRDAYGYGRFKNPATGQCLDTLQSEEDASPLGVYPCHNTLQSSQFFSLSVAGQLRDENSCVELQYNRQDMEDDGVDTDFRLMLVDCRKSHGKVHYKKRWKYLPKTQQLQHVATKLCVDAGDGDNGRKAVVSLCRPGAPAQQWHIQYSQNNAFGALRIKEMTSQELTLQKLRGRTREISEAGS